jgi:hypothetical protein
MYFWHTLGKAQNSFKAVQTGIDRVFLFQIKNNRKISSDFKLENKRTVEYRGKEAS